jgi:amino acid transporter
VNEHQTSEGGYERLGQKKLGLVDVPAIVGANAAATGAGVAAPLSVLIAAIGVYALGWIVAQYAKRIHAAGALYDYVSNGLGRTIGGAAGWLYYGGTIILTTGLGVLIGGYVHDILLPTLGVEGEVLPIWAWNAIWAVLLFAILFFGVQISTRVQLTLALISVVAVLLFFVKVISDLGGDNDFGTVFDPNSSPDGWSGIFFGVLYGVLIFVGFETAANLAEETAHPKKHIPRAVLISVVVVSLFYLVASYVEVAGFGFNLDRIFEAAGAGPLFVLSAPDAFGSDLIAKVIVVVVLLDILAVGVGAAVASTRGVFAMARDRRLPALFASVNRRYGTPTGAIALLMLVQAVLIWANEFREDLFALEGLPHYFSLFIWCATFGGFALLVVYLAMSVGALFGLSDHPRRVTLWIGAILGIAITGAGIFGSFYKVPSPTILAPFYALGLLGVGLLFSLIARGREPASRVIPELRTHQE